MPPAANTPGEERRRSPRLLRRMPVRLVGENQGGQRVSEPGEAMALSAHGALVKTNSEFRPGSTLSVEGEQGRRASFRVIWATEKPLEGLWDIGLELNAGEKAPWGDD
ncbi:MAG: PilZ domain-containing protein [Terriglobia bacterium]